MSIDDKQPLYTAKLGEWIQCGDCYAGERRIKSKRLDYLPPSEAMLQDGMSTPSSPGWKDYEAYLTRAYFHDVFRDAVSTSWNSSYEACGHQTAEASRADDG